MATTLSPSSPLPDTPKPSLVRSRSYQTIITN